MNQSDTNNPATRRIHQATELADTGLWHLIAGISQTGIQAWLKSKTDPTSPAVLQFSRTWDDDPEKLLENIENTVYDHPGLLDDYSTDIVIRTPKTLWIPSGIADNSDDIEFFNSIYPAKEADIFRDDHDGCTCLYMPVCGLRSFLSRTFSGSRISSHLSLQYSHFRSRAVEDPHIFVCLSEREFDMTGIDSSNLLFSATHTWHQPEDVVYHIINAISAYCLDSDRIRICLAGNPLLKKDQTPLLRRYFRYVLPANVPSSIRNENMPLEIALCAARTRSY